jgi:hypothetical protein
VQGRDLEDDPVLGPSRTTGSQSAVVWLADATQPVKADTQR